MAQDMGGLLPIECSWEQIHTFVIIAACQDHKLKLQPSCFLTRFSNPRPSFLGLDFTLVSREARARYITPRPARVT